MHSEPRHSLPDPDAAATLLGHLLDSVPQSIFWKDRDSVYLGCNRAFASAVGLSSPDRIIGLTDDDLPFPHPDVEAYRADDREVMASGHPKWHICEPLQQVDGSRIWIDTIKVPLRDSRGAVIGVLGIFADITESRRTKQALQDSERMLQIVLDTIPARVFWKDRDLVYLGCNRLFAADAGMAAPSEIVGLTDFDLGWRDQATQYRRDDTLVLEIGVPKLGYEEPQTAPGGQQIWLRTSKIPLRDDDGVIIGVLGTYEDVTERRQTEQALRERLASEELTAAISTHFVNLRPQEIDLGVLEALRSVGRFTGADRSYVFLFRDDGRVMDNTHEWCAEGIEAQRERLQGLAVSDFPSVGGCILHGEAMTVARVADLADDHAAERAEFEREGIRSLALVPMSCRGRVIGFIGLDSVGRERDFGADAVALLRIVGEILANGLERRRYEESLRASEARLRSIFRASPVGIGLVRERVLLEVNERVCEMTGYARDELVGRSARHLYPTQEEFDFVGREKYAQIRRAGVGTVETRWLRRDGSVIDVLMSSVPLDPDDIAGGVTFTALDITERKRSEEERRRLEAQVQHVQKLESLGVLAGGIAHDFNNLLMAILGNADLAGRSLAAESPGQAYLQDIETAARRAADLCRQMLAYSGKGRFVVEPIALDDIILEMTRMLEVSISKKATLQYHLGRDLPAVAADATQVRQIVMNLITNASEALGDHSGIIAIATGTMDCDRAYLNETYLAESLPEGAYVWLEITDSGVGMTPEIQARMFDPFFSTKFTGRGLGMAAVLGIVRGHRGGIRVYSEPGRGTTIRVFFPVSREAAVRKTEPAVTSTEWRGAGTVLVVDDDETVCALACRMLALMGFTTVVAGDGRRAVEIYRERRDDIVCVLLDLTMPHMDGEEAYHELRRLDRGVRVIMSSGYNESEVTRRFQGEGLAGFIQKPYLFAALRDTLRTVLDARPRADA